MADFASTHVKIARDDGFPELKKEALGVIDTGKGFGCSCRTLDSIYVANVYRLGGPTKVAAFIILDEKSAHIRETTWLYYSTTVRYLFYLFSFCPQSGKKRPWPGFIARISFLLIVRAPASRLLSSILSTRSFGSPLSISSCMSQASRMAREPPGILSYEKALALCSASVVKLWDVVITGAEERMYTRYVDLMR